MKCPNPSCEREMRLTNFDYSQTRFRTRFCKYCGRGADIQVGEVHFWKCDNCGAQVWSPEELRLFQIAKGAPHG